MAIDHLIVETLIIGRRRKHCLPTNYIPIYIFNNDRIKSENKKNHYCLSVLMVTKYGFHVA